MSDLEELKQWVGSVQADPRFTEFIANIHSGLTDGFDSLTDEEILATAVPRVAALRGGLQCLNAILTFADLPNLDFGKPVPETYPDEVEEANAVNLPPTPPEPTKKPRKRK